MARNQKAPQVNDDSQEEMTVVIFKLKGGPTTLQKGFDAINTAFASFGSTALPPSNPRRLVSGGNSKTGQVIPPDDLDDAMDEEDGEISDTSEAVVKNTTKPWQPRKYKFLADFDLTQSDKTWKDFATEKSPKAEGEKYLVAALWVTENAHVIEFGITHIFTCFRAVGWPEQKDFSQPMRLMKSNKSYFTNPSAKMCKLTGPGLIAARDVKPE